MSDLVLADDTVLLALDEFRQRVNTLGLVMRLYKNNHTPTKASVRGDYTEAAFAGYAPQSLNLFAAPILVAHVATSVHPLLTWTVTGASPGEVVYGYFVTDATDTVFYWSELYDLAPATMDTAGQMFSVTSQLSDESEFG